VYSTIRSLHNRFVLERRAKVLSGLLAGLLPANSDVLDVGCGDGLIGYLITQSNPTVRVRGLEVMARPSSRIECLPFDGRTIPMGDSSVDVCLFVDVLHHTLKVEQLLNEARRVTRRYVLLKDHVCSGHYDRAALSFMDWVGNRPHGVTLPYNYQSRESWKRIFSTSALQIVMWTEDIPLYPLPFGWLFGRNMHCIVLLEKQ
jgi:SAM-dependent methyltransferase